MKRASHYRCGFTLVELLVVIGVIAVLVAILLPALNRAMASARAIKCAANLKQMGTAFMMYRSNYNNFLPPVNSFKSHMATNSAGEDPDWSLPKNYGMWNTLGAYVGLPEWGGILDPALAPAGINHNLFTGYMKFDSYWGPNADGGKKFRKSIFLCPETLPYGEARLGPFTQAGYGESVYLQAYPSGTGKNWPTTGGTPGVNYGKTDGVGLPRNASKIKNPSISIAVSEKGGGTSSDPKYLPLISTITPANYPPRDNGTPLNDWDMYRHYGGCNILYADGHVTYHKGTEILTRIVKDTDAKSMRNYQMR